MQECHYELVKELIEIEILKKDFYSKQEFASTLSVCKKGILEGYINAIEDLLVGYAHILHELENVKKADLVKTRLEYLLRLFQRSTIKNFRKSRISKLFYFFCIFKDTFEPDVIKDSTHEIIDHFSSDYRDTPRVAYERILTRFYSHIELSYLFMSGIQLNCDNIKDTVFKSSCFNIFRQSSENVESICKEQEKCGLFKLSEDDEIIHLFMLPEYGEKNFINRNLRAIVDIHKSPKSISVVVDYKLQPAFTYTDDNYQDFVLASKIFRNVKFSNCNHIDFGKYKKYIEIEQPDYRDAVRSLMQRSRRDAKIPLTGEILSTISNISKADIEEALDRQKDVDKPIGEILKDKDLINNSGIEAALNVQKECEPEGSDFISAEIVERILSKTSVNEPD